MSTIVKHNRKTWTDSERVTEHIYQEQFYLEIHHNDKKHEQTFVSSEKLGITTSNAKIGYWESWEQFESTNDDKFYLTYPINIAEDGNYWVELAYHSSMEGTYPAIFYMDGIKEDVQLKGSNNFLTRFTKQYQLQKGEHELKLALNPYLCVLGLVVKKIDTYGADHTLSRKNKLTCTSVTHTESEKVGADELSFELLYDSDWKDPESLTDFLFDYRDEVNFSVINTNGDMEQIFGGYVSTCTLNSDETLLTVKCAGRLIDGEKRYVVEEMCVGGQASDVTEEHLAEDIQYFENYNNAIDYLFGAYETTLNSNMNEVFKEKQFESIDIDLTKKENFDKCKKENITATLEDLGVYLRNNSGANQNQSIKLYDSDWYSSDPICLDEYPIFYMTYGMGEPMTSTESGGDSSGVSSDGSVITVKCKPSCCCCAGTPYTWYTKSWKNYCPLCKRSGSLTDNPKGVPEHEITCGDGKAPWTDGCDADYCCYCGGDKGSCATCRKTKLVSASASESSNSGNTSSSSSKKSNKNLSNVFQTITNEAFKYQYKLRGGTCSDWACMQRNGYGDCWAFSDLIYTRLKQAGIACKIVDYVTSGSAHHRSVLYKDTNGEWQDFPYRQYGWGSHYNNMLNNTSASKSGRVIASTDGTGADAGTGSSGTVTTTNGFDKDKQFMAWIRIEFSKSPNKTAGRQSFYIDFTAEQSDSEHTYRGFTPISLNNIINTGSISVVNKVIEQWDIETVYLRSIALEYRVLDETLWENTDSSIDNSSYRMILKNVGFRNGIELNPTDLGSTGKTINEVLGTVVENGQLHMRMYPSQYRRDDRMVVRRKVETDPTFTCIEGKNGNIIDISSWSFSPVSDYINRSLVVYKSKQHDEENSIYHYLCSRRPDQILRYGELSDLVSISDNISEQEGYYEAVKNPNYDSGRTGSSMTVTVIGVPADIKVGDYVEVVLEDNHYTDWKEVKSISHEYYVDSSPKLITKLGLNRPERVVELLDEFENQRKLTKTKQAVFAKTATYNQNEVFKWED